MVTQAEYAVTQIWIQLWVFFPTLGEYAVTQIDELVTRPEYLGTRTEYLGTRTEYLGTQTEYIAYSKWVYSEFATSMQWVCNTLSEYAVTQHTVWVCYKYPVSSLGFQCTF